MVVLYISNMHETIGELQQRTFFLSHSNGTQRISVVDPDRIRIIFPHPDRHPGHADPDPAAPDRYQFQANEKFDKLNFFQENFDMLVKILKIMTHLTLIGKIVKWQCYD
jgi:hypothetical protein